MKVHFYKYQGTGNDFVIMDNRHGAISLNQEQVKNICNRRFGVGADGLMLLNNKSGYDFEMKYYNADGNEGSMCGNGGRCLVQFAHHIGLHKNTNTYHFVASDGEHEAILQDNYWVNLKMKDVDHIQQHYDAFILNTGSPHYVVAVNDLKKLNVYEEGKKIRYSDKFTREGINVNFVELRARHIYVRTYERGVEDETFSCGTGVTACALVFAHNENGFNRVEIETMGGRLAVEFNKTSDTKFDNIWLCGPAIRVFKGDVEV